ncbi:unnamed protein product, partial [Ectocarpus fasciculatus]
SFSNQLAQRQQLETQRGLMTPQQAAQARQQQQNQLKVGMSGQQAPGLHQSGSIDQFNNAHGGADTGRGGGRSSSKPSASNGKRSSLIGAPGTIGTASASGGGGAVGSSSSSSNGMMVDPNAIVPANNSRAARSLAHQQT